MPKGTFIVDRALGALPLTRLLDVRSDLRLTGVITPPIVVEGDRPVLTGEQALQPNVLYPSDKNSGLRYYLPDYRVSIDELGRPAVELRYKDGDSDEVGRLTITTTWTPPQAAGVEVRVMDHVVALALRHRVPVEGDGGATAGPGWEHTVPLQPLQPIGGGFSQSVTIFREKTIFDTVYQALRSANQQPQLELQIRARVGVRTWKQVIVGKPTLSTQATILEARGSVLTKMVNKESLATVRTVPATGVAKIRLTAPAPIAKPVVTPRAGRAAAPRVSARVLSTPLVTARAVSPAAPAATTTARLATPPARMATAVTSPVMARAVLRSPVVVTPSATTPATPAAPAPAVATVATALRQPTAATAVLHTPAIKLSQAVAVSDLKIAGKLAVPVQLVLDPSKQPAVVDSDLDNLQLLAFHFDPSLPTHKDVFAVAGFDSGGIHLLLPLRLTAPDGSAHVVYQDNLMRDVVHVAPSEFRLERDATPPFLPSISFLATDFSTADADKEDEADVLFRVAAIYRLEPWLDPDVVELARAELARQGLVARFTTSMSHDAKLSLDLDLLEDGQQRTDATVDPAVGITDSLDLDHNTFLRLWRERLANPTSGGVTGRVEYKLFDGSAAQVKVRLSLWEASAELFDVAFIGPVEGQPGRCRVLARNRIESPARITALPGEIVGGTLARAVDPQATIGQLLQPQETREIVYELADPAADTSSFEPSILARAEPNLPALLKLLMLTPGYTSLGFSLPVRAAANAFVPATGGAEPLTGLLVEFDDGARVMLSPEDPEADVTLVGRLIDQILGTAGDSQRYFYRVTNLHTSGEGARTGWNERQGTAPLEVGTAVVQLDF